MLVVVLGWFNCNVIVLKLVSTDRLMQITISEAFPFIAFRASSERGRKASRVPGSPEPDEMLR